MEGAAVIDGNTADTPLQIASASGYLNIVNLLLQYGADAHLTTLLQSGVEVKNSCSSFTLAASHGQRYISSKLLGHHINLLNFLSAVELITSTVSINM